jgi:hypothetical protein
MESETWKESVNCLEFSAVLQKCCTRVLRQLSRVSGKEKKSAVMMVFDYVSDRFVSRVNGPMTFCKKSAYIIDVIYGCRNDP